MAKTDPEYKALHAVVAAADDLLNYAGLDDYLDTARDADAFGIRAADLRRLREALRALDAAR